MTSPLIYREKSSLYDYIFGSTASKDKDFSMEFIQWFLSNHGFDVKDKNKTILDMGCGTGRLLIPLTLQGYNISGMEPFPDMIDKAKEKAEAQNLDITTIVGSFQTLQETQAYDLVMAINGSIAYLTSIEDMDAAFGNVFNALKPNGYFIVDVMNFYGLIKKYQYPIPQTMDVKGAQLDVFTTHELELRNSLWTHKSSIYVAPKDPDAEMYTKFTDKHELALISPRELQLHARNHNFTQKYHFLSYQDRPDNPHNGIRTILIFQK